VLLTNVAAAGEDAYSAEQILRTYKEQHGIEKNFGFLKDDAIVNALFLKTPERIEALGLILLIALLIWRLMEFHMRRHLSETQTQLPGWDNKPTARPSAYMVTIKFKGVLILKHDEQRCFARPLSSTQHDFLRALGLNETIFLQPQRCAGPSVLRAAATDYG
jgi:transposase